MSAGEEAPRLRRTARGKRPRYFSDPAIDRLLGMLTTLIGEVSVLRDRLDSVERLIEKGGLFERTDIDSFVPNAAEEAEREDARRRYIERVMRVLQNEMEEKTPVANMPPVTRVHREFEEGQY